MLNKIARQIGIAGQRLVVPTLGAVDDLGDHRSIRRRNGDRVASIVQAKRARRGRHNLSAAKIARWRTPAENNDCGAYRQGRSVGKCVAQLHPVRDCHA